MRETFGLHELADPMIAGLHPLTRGDVAALHSLARGDFVASATWAMGAAASMAAASDVPAAIEEFMSPRRLACCRPRVRARSR